MTELLSWDLLARLESAWAENKAPIHSALRPGLSSAEIEDIMAPVGLDLPFEARMWWSWHDGGAGEIGPDLPFLPLAEAVSRYEVFLGLSVEIAGPKAVRMWDPTWFPITDASIGPIVVDCSVRRDEPTPIRQINWELPPEEAARPQAESLGEAVMLWIDAYATRVWSFDREAGAWDYHPELIDPSRRGTGLV